MFVATALRKSDLLIRVSCAAALVAMRLKKMAVIILFMGPAVLIAF
jgi:hypothetical protein